MQLQALCDTVRSYPLLQALDMSQVIKFLRYCALARPSIEAQTRNSRIPPDAISVHTQVLLGEVIGVNLSVVRELWSALKGEVWKLCTSGDSPNGIVPTAHEISIFNTYALCVKTSYRHIFPPTRVCLVRGCENFRESNDIATLTEPNTYRAALFTLHQGSLPVYTTSLYCRSCKRRYYHNYVVHEASNTRQYYGGVPEIIQTAEHFFVDRPLAELFVICALRGWVSASNFAKITNNAISNQHADVLNNHLAYSADILAKYVRKCPDRWAPSSLQLHDTHVLNTFFLYSTLLDHAERKETLVLPHNVSNQKDRLQPTLQKRNKRTKGVGQEAYTHACSACFLVLQDENGNKTKIHPAVCDGVTIGHLCCLVHDCPLPLVHSRSLYCSKHMPKRLECAVIGCTKHIEAGFRTCSLPEHRSVEENFYQQGQSIFHLRTCLKKATDRTSSNRCEDAEMQDAALDGGSVPHDSKEPTSCDGKDERGNGKVKASFSKRRTHNEQFVVRPCGVIVSRTTLYGSEALTEVKDFAKATFPTPESTPEFFVFDNNCRLHAHLSKQKDNHFKNTGMPVDVFHFKSKHKVTDHRCQMFCNPAAFPELMDGDKWKVNTSVCEQTNSWLVGYQAILRDMEATRFCFYLDEMVKRYNRFKIQDLEEKGLCPWNIPVHMLFPQK